MQSSWLVLVPPLVVIVLAIATRRVLFALVMGIISASLIIQDFDIIKASEFMTWRLVDVTEINRFASWDLFTSGFSIFVCPFLIVIGVLILLIQRSGAVYAYGAFISRRLKSTTGAECSSLLLSMLFFIDDYFSCLTVGSVMQPITDQFKVPRIKLALLVNSVAAPLAVLVPLSTWVALIVGQLKSAGVWLGQKSIITADPFSLYLGAIPFLFYAALVLLSLWFIVWRRLSHGTIAQHELYAQKTGSLFAGKTPLTKRVPTAGGQGAVIDFLVPVILLFCSVVGWILYVGKWWLLGGSNTVLQALQQVNPFAAFCGGGLIALTLSVIFLVARKKIRITQLPGIFKDGTLSMLDSIVLLLFIWTLSNMLAKDLGTGDYVASLVVGKVSLWLMPAIFFVLTACVSIAIVTAWGTIGILIPLAVGMLPSLLGLDIPIHLVQAPILFVLIGAIISGAIVGNHVSPIADVMIMSAKSTGAYHIDFVKGSASFAIPTFFSSLIAFGCAGFLVFHGTSLWLTSAISLLVGFAMNVSILYLLRFISKLR